MFSRNHWNIESHLNVRSVMLAAKSEHSDNLIQRWVEPRSSCGPTLTCQTSLLPLPFNQHLDCWNQQILSHRSKHPTVIQNLLCRQSESQALSTNLLCFIEILSFGKNHWYTDESDCNYTWEEFDNPKEFAGSNMTLPLELNDSTLSKSCLKAVSPLSVVSHLFH